MLLDWSLISVGIGLFVGLVLAITGAGGSILAIPLLMVGLNLSLQQAAPIALLAVMLAATIGTIQGLRKGIVRYKTALLIACFGVAFAPLGVWLAAHAPNKILHFIFAALLLYIAWYMRQQIKMAEAINAHLANQDLPEMPCVINKFTSKLYWTAFCSKRLIATGAMAGFVSGLLGVGGGFVIVPSLSKVSNFSMQSIIATSLMAIALVSIASIVSYSLAYPLQWKIAIPFVLSTVLGLLIFGRFSDKVPTKYSQLGFASLAVLAAILLLLKH
jgi:uncharacterized protein